MDDERTDKPIEDILIKDVAERATAASPKLRSQLVGTIITEITGTPKRFFFDGSKDQVVTSVAGDAPAECVIKVTENDVRRIVRGSLNPQVAMLSDKIQVEGVAQLAIYYFNLLAPVVNP